MSSEQHKDAMRHVMAAALCDFVAHLGTRENPIVCGGSYKDDKLIASFNKWLNNRKFDISDASLGAETWLMLCVQGTFAGEKNFDSEPEPEPEPKPEPKPEPEPKPGPEPNFEPEPPIAYLSEPELPSTDSEDNIPEEGYFNENDWMPKEYRKKHWAEEGEDWRGEDNEESTPA